MDKDKKVFPSIGSTPQRWERLKAFARANRHEPTPAETALWQRLRNRAVGGAKFRRQHAVDWFIVDLICLDARLVIEVDGEIHQQDDHHDYDELRQSFLSAQGLRFLRFTNDQVLQDIDNVLDTIAHTLTESVQRD
jgi:very-short-patch-repair endonuclease